jgi:alpha-glucosidase
MTAMTDYKHSRARLLFALVALACLFLLHAEARAAWRAAGDVQKVERRADGVVLTLSSGARVSVTFTDLEVVRVRLAPRGTFERDFSYAVEPKDRKTVAATVAETRDLVKISSLNGTSVVVRRRPFLVTVLDADGRVVVEDDPARPASFDPDTGAVESSKRRAEWETYYGLGEKAAPMSRHTQQFVMWNTDTYGYPRGLDPIYQSIGFFVALRHERGRGLSYGLFLDNTTRTYFDMGKTDPSRYTFGAAGGELNYYVFTGSRERSPKKILRDYTDLTGRTPLPPLWALGNQQSRWSYFPEARVREVARKFRETRIPVDVIYLDIDYMDGFRVFTWDKSRFPDPARMISDLRREGLRTVVIIDPGIKVDDNYHVYREGRAGNHFVKASDGSEFHGTVWPGVCAFPDFTSAAAREWFASYYRQHLAEGVAGFWNDMNEPGIFLSETTPKPDIYHHPMKTFPLDARHAGDGAPGTHARYHNVYGMQMARSTFEGLRRHAPDARPFVLTRAGYAGVQRYSAVWTGDNVASWDHLRLSIPMLANLGVSGVALVGADVGGFSGNPSPELYARWLQAAALTPFLRSHSEYVSKPHEPYAFGDEFTRINRASVELRYRLLPYLYTLFREHTQTGAPVMRPLWFEYPDDDRTYLVEDQYMVGRDLLVAPVVTEGETKRRVYFPRGDVWVDWWTGRRYEGGRDAEVDAPLDRLPLFARAGSTVPTQPVVQHTGEMLRAPLSLVVVRGADGESTSYEDAGEGYEYLRGAFRTTTVTQRGNNVGIGRTGAYNVSRPVAAVEFLGLTAEPRAVRASDVVLTPNKFDPTTGRLVVPLPHENTLAITIEP